MYEKLFDCFANPVKCKLLIEISAQKKTTAKQLAEVCRDIPQTSLYRYLKNLTEDGVIEVVEERPIRGTVEKVYAMGADFTVSVEKMISENNGEAYMLLFTQYMMGLMKEFREYTSRPDIDIRNDCSAFSLAPVYVTREEWETAAHKIGDILADLMKNKKTPERSLHNIGIIVTPPKDADESWKGVTE